MPVVSGGGGGSLPAQLTVDPATGALTITLTGAAGDHDFADALTITNSDGRSVLGFDSSGELAISTGDANASALAIIQRTPVAGNHAIQVSGSPGGLDFDVEDGQRTSVQGLRTLAILAGALPTVSPVSGTAFQCSTLRDVFLTVPVTYNPGVATTATCIAALSPDNVTFSTLVVRTVPVGTVFDGQIDPIDVHVPAGWYVKLTVTNATLGTGTYY